MMAKKRAAKAGKDDDPELDRWIAESLADTTSVWGPPLERDFGARPSDDDIWRIAQEANRYLPSHRVASNPIAKRTACEHVDEAAETLKAAIAETAKYFANLDTLWKRGADKAVARIQREARKLAMNRQRKSKYNAPLRSLTAVVLQAYHNTGKTGLGIGTHHETGKLYGPVLNAVKTSLRLVDTPEDKIPSDSTIRGAARDVVDREGK